MYLDHNFKKTKQANKQDQVQVSRLFICVYVYQPIMKLSANSKIAKSVSASKI